MQFDNVVYNGHVTYIMQKQVKSKHKKDTLCIFLKDCIADNSYIWINW